MPRFPEIKVALDELHRLERKLKNPGGPVEDLVALYAVRVATVSLETAAQIGERAELSVTTK